MSVYIGHTAFAYSYHPYRVAVALHFQSQGVALLLAVLFPAPTCPFSFNRVLKLCIRCNMNVLRLP